MEIDEESVDGLFAAAMGDSMNETDEPMEDPGSLNEDSSTLRETESQTEQNTLESYNTTSMKLPEAHPTLISDDTDNVPRDDGTEAFMANGEELQNHLHISSEFGTFKVPWKPDVKPHGAHDEGKQTQQNQYSGQSTVGTFQTLLNMADPLPSYLQTSEHDGHFEGSILSFSGWSNDAVPETSISQYDEASASPTEAPLGNQSTGVNTEKLHQNHIPSISGVRAESMEAFEEAGNEYMDDPPDPEDKEERRKMKNRKASGKSRESIKIRNDCLFNKMKGLQEEIEPLEQQHRMLHEKHENAKTSARHRDEFISIGHYLEIYVMPLVLKYCPENETEEENLVLINEEVNEEEEKLEVPSVPPAPIRQASQRGPRAKNVKAININEKRSNKEASKRYRDQEHKYWKAIEERIEMLKTKCHVLKRKIDYFQVCEGKIFRENELRKSILRRQYIVPGLKFDEFTKIKLARWFYSVGLTEEELCSLFEEDKYLTLPIGCGFFHLYVSTRPEDNILVIDFSPHPPQV